MAGSCETCEKAPPEVSLKRCAKCHTAEYCSHECQKAAWKQHKKVCGRQSDSDGPRLPHIHKTVTHTSDLLSPARGCEAPITKPFTRLKEGTFLHDRPETDVYKILIDAYRFRFHEDRLMAGSSLLGNIPALVNPEKGLEDFNSFLDKAEKVDGLLPSWWSPEKRIACCASIMRDGNEFSILLRELTKAGVLEHYDDLQFPDQLRMVAEAVYGTGAGGRPRTTTSFMILAAESGDLSGKVFTMNLR